MNTLTEIREAFEKGLDPKFTEVLVTLESWRVDGEEDLQIVRFEGGLEGKEGKVYSRIALSEQIPTWEDGVKGALNVFARVLDPTIPALYASATATEEV